ncbi:MAG: gamma-glutamylcyclotransferase [Gammaproteobacteria bacterium]|nr:gamma-glutamylcyclotransferase [Gammaproteobacteria bacterium]MCY4324310.1 gamma-glutamylcyclotransferase [Gammaproteobacteria bacterium]
MNKDLWLFGYGSIIWRTGFPYIERRAARLSGFVRRYWQGSHDHRGTDAAPGRVVTLIAENDGHCDGAAYLIAGENVEAVLDGLDYREKNGYERRKVKILLSDGERLPPDLDRLVPTAAVTYLAPLDNHAFLGAAPMEDIVHQMRCSAGPSGTNLDYALRLAESVRALGGRDAHVEAVGDKLRDCAPC